MTSTHNERIIGGGLDRDTTENTNGWKTQSTKQKPKSSHRANGTSDSKFHKGFSKEHSKGKGKSPAMTTEFREARAKKEHSQDIERQHRRMSYTLKQSNVKVGQSLVDNLMRDFSEDRCNAVDTVAKIIKHCRSKALDACKKKMSESEATEEQTVMFDKLVQMDIPINDYIGILNDAVRDKIITEECATVLTALFNSNRATEECAKVLDELVRYHRADIIEHPDIVDLLNTTKPQDGYTYYHWLVFPSRASGNTFDKNEFIRCIKVLHRCGCSPFAKNLKNESCIDAMLYSARKVGDKEPAIPRQFVNEIYLSMLDTPAFIRRNMLINCLNKVTLDKVDQFASLICWSVHHSIDDLVHDFVSRCVKVTSSSKTNGHYKSIDTLHEIIMCALKMGPQGNANCLKVYFDTHPWDGLEAVSKFFHGVLEYTKSISTEPLDPKFGDNSLGAIIIEEDSDGNVIHKLNPRTACADALGAIIGEIGNTPHINEYVEEEFEAGNIMNAITCIAHGKILTQSIANSVTKRINTFTSKDKVFIELAVKNVTGVHIPCSAYPALEFTSSGSLIHCSVSIASSPTQSSVGEGNTWDCISDDESIYIPPFNVEDADKFGIFNGFGTTQVTDITTNSSGEFVPSCVDDAVFSLEKRLKGCYEISTIVAVLAKIIDSTNGIEVEVAKFVVDRCKVSASIINSALRLIADIPHEEISSCFDNPQANNNIEKLFKLYKFEPNPVAVSSLSTNTGKFSLLLEEDLSDNEYPTEITYEDNAQHVVVTPNHADRTFSPSTNSTGSGSQSKNRGKNSNRKNSGKKNRKK